MIILLKTLMNALTITMAVITSVIIHGGHTLVYAMMATSWDLITGRVKVTSHAINLNRFSLISSLLYI